MFKNNAGEKSSPQYYLLYLPDWSTPGFVSGDCEYICTLDGMRVLIEKSKNADSELETLFSAFCEGNIAITHWPEYVERRFLTPVDLLHTASYTVQDYSWEYEKGWGGYIFMHADKMESCHLWVSVNDEFMRFVFPRIENLTYQDEEEPWNPITAEFIFGFPGIILISDTTVYSSLGELEKRFYTRDEAEKDYVSFVEDPKPVLISTTRDIFGEC